MTSRAPLPATNRETVIATLREHGPELKSAGIASLSLFGSDARGDTRPDSDVDLLVRLSEDAAQGGFVYFSRLDALKHRLTEILGRPVDLVTEPVHKDKLLRAIETERALAL